MANEEQLKILKRGRKAWSQWRKDHPFIELDLCEAYLVGVDLNNASLRDADLSTSNLSHANLSEADLSRAFLRVVSFHDANLSRATLEEANLSRADLSGANLSGADLNRANLSRANLFGADLRGANLHLTNFNSASLRGAIFDQAIVGSTTFDDVDFRGVKGLETVLHYGPSSIGIDTIYRSQGEIPDIFLRGTGVPENFIVYMHSLVGKAIQFYSCFISYSTKDQEFAERLHSDLQSKGVRVWFAPDDIKGGRKLHEQIPEAIRLYDKLLLVLSENSMRSEWVKTEIYHARQDEIQNNKRKLFPIGLVDFGTIRNWEAFDADSGKDMAREIREYFIPDFSNWKDHDAYKKAFDRLLHDLEAEG